MPNDKEKDVINILVVGKTGVGKSSTANSILGSKAFISKQSTGSVTQKYQHAFGKYEGRRTKLVDMPGLSDASLTPKEDVKRVMDQAADAVTETPDGYSVILIVVKLDRFTQEDAKIFAILKGIFGDKYLTEYGILVVTHADQFDPEENDHQTLDQWCFTQESDQKSDFKKFINECSGRVVFFQNKTKDENIRAQQLEQLFTMADKLMHQERYTPELFKAAQSSRKLLLLELKVPDIGQNTQRKIELVFEKLKGLKSKETTCDVKSMKKLKNKTEKMLKQLKCRDKGTGALHGVIREVESAHEAVKASIDAAVEKQNLKLQEEANKKLAESLEIHKKMEEDRDEKKEALKEKVKLAMVFTGIAAAFAGVAVVGSVTVPAIIAATKAVGIATGVAGTAGAATGVAGTAAAATGVAGTAAAATGIGGTAAVATGVAGTAAAATGVVGAAAHAVTVKAIASGVASGVGICGGSALSATSYKHLSKQKKVEKMKKA